MFWDFGLLDDERLAEAQQAFDAMPDARRRLMMLQLRPDARRGQPVEEIDDVRAAPQLGDVDVRSSNSTLLSASLMSKINSF